MLVKIALTQGDATTNMPSLRWSWHNRILALVTTGALDCRGVRQWQEEGRWIDQWDAHTHILKPILKTRTVERTDDDGNPYESEEQVLVGFGTLPVWPDWATGGAPIDGSVTQRTPPPLNELLKRYGMSTLSDHEREGALAATVRQLAGHMSEEWSKQSNPRIYLATALLKHMYSVRYDGSAWDYISEFAKDDPLTALQGALAFVKEFMTQIFDDEPTDLSLDPAHDAQSEDT